VLIYNCVNLQTELMKESVARSNEIEEAKGGLVIRKALYGRLIGGSRWCVDDYNYQTNAEQLRIAMPLPI